MKFEKKLLGKRILAMYDYNAIKKILVEWLEDTDMLRFRLKSLYLPSPNSQSYVLREEQFVPTTVSKE